MVMLGMELRKLCAKFRAGGSGSRQHIRIAELRRVSDVEREARVHARKRDVDAPAIFRWVV